MSHFMPGKSVGNDQLNSAAMVSTAVLCSEKAMHFAHWKHKDVCSVPLASTLLWSWSQPTWSTKKTRLEGAPQPLLCACYMSHWLLLLLITAVRFGLVSVIPTMQDGTQQCMVGEEVLWVTDLSHILNIKESKMQGSGEKGDRACLVLSLPVPLSLCLSLFSCYT